MKSLEVHQDNVNNRTHTALYALGVLLMIGIAYLAFLSTRFEYGSYMLQRPIRTLVILLVVLSALYLTAIYLITRIESNSTPLLLWILTVGFIARLILMPSSPILEDDFYRYLWDGGVTANGYNPYQYTPNDIQFHHADAGVPQQLTLLSEESGLIAERINHADLGTIYPPLAQAAFALAHFIHPWSLFAWKIVLLLVDGVVLGMMLLILRHIGTPLTRITIYWWNPLILKEIYNSAHMDLLYVPAILLAVWFALRHQAVRSGMALACGVAIKIWPIILAPLLLRHLKVSPKHIAVSIVAGTVVLILLFLPVLPAIDLGERSGFLAYSDDWEMNDAVFMIFAKGVKTPLALTALTDRQLDRTVRVIVTLALLVWIALLSRRPMQSHHDLLNRLTLVAGFFFMISPTQFPWYYLWVLPFLVFSPRPSLLILTAMLPLYYLKFYYAALDNIAFFHYRIVWIEYAPVFLLAVWEARRYFVNNTSEVAAHA